MCVFEMQRKKKKLANLKSHAYSDIKVGQPRS